MTTTCIITALPCESRAFIDTFKLRHLEARGMRLYGNEQYLLLQTGIGKLQAAAATAALLQSRPGINAIINTGVAGGAAAIGTTLMGHQIRDAASGAQWFPHLPPQRVTAQLATALVHTVDVPCTDYQEGVLYDMEASGMFSAASRYLSTDRMHTIKVISDNASNSTETLHKDQVTKLMQGAATVVARLHEWQMSKTHGDCSTITVTTLGQAIVARVRHTVSERHQLLRLLQQYSTIAGTPPELDEFEKYSSARQIKHYLQTSLASLPFVYGT